MDYDQDSDSEGFSKVPFYGAAAFIFVVICLFASVVLKEEGTLGHWQIATCLLGTGLISLLLFLPHFLQSMVDKLEESANRQESDLSSKAFFELKEIRSELDALALKVDKVPTLVNKIVSDSMVKDTTDLSTEGIIDRLKDMESEIRTRLDRMEETPLSPSPIPELDPAITNLDEKVTGIISQIELIREKLDSLSTHQERPPQSSDQPVPELTETSDPPSFVEEEDLSSSSIQQPEPDMEEILPETESADEETVENGESDDANEETFEEPDGSNELTPQEEEEEEEETTLIEEAEEPLSADPPEETEEVPIPAPEEISPTVLEQVTEQAPQELDLGLPDPQETLRKVDALLAGNDLPAKAEEKDSEKDKADKNATTTVVANVMIGIGNKPYLRGEGPGLNWDEGVSMNFIEIGKWAWSPPRKNASLTVQVYRNDQDPDKGGKFEVKPGQRLEITPDFS